MSSRRRRKLRKAKIGALIAMAVAIAACVGNRAGGLKSVPVDAPEENAEPTPEHSFVQKELVDGKDAVTDSEIGGYDFRNHKYPLPRGWHDTDGNEFVLADGVRRMSEEKIGLEFLTAKYFDVTGDGEDEAAVVLQIRTGGSAIPQIVYIFEWNEEKPELIWFFRTGDRADGGLKKIFAEDGTLVLELFGQDRYVFDQMETLPIPGDEVQLCCPTHFTRTRYVRRGSGFSMEGDRLTYSLSAPGEPPVANLGEIRLKEQGGSQ